MNKICTSLSQSKKLIELGVDINTADMYYSFDYNIEEYDEDAQIIPKSELGQHFSLFPKDILAWSLTALFNIIPKKINFGYENDSTFVLKPLENGKYLADYYEVSFVKDNPIDVAFEMVVWLLENKKL